MASQMPVVKEMLRWNSAYYFWEYGHWFISRFGSPMWKHKRIASSWIPTPMFPGKTTGG